LKEEEIYLLITRYLSQQTSPSENLQLTEWISLSKENEELFGQIAFIWNVRKSDTDPETLRTLKNTQAKLGMGQSQEIAKSVVFGKRKAAVYLIAGVCVILISIFLLLVKNSKPTSIIYTTSHAKPGQKIKVILSDGSIVSLAPESEIKYPVKFDEHQRDVYLQGEAFFEVSKNPHRPFVVHSGSWATKVFGTKFNVLAFDKAPRMVVSLLEGKVQVSSAGKNYPLKPGQQLVLDKSDNRIYLHGFDEEEVTGWIKNKLVFKNTRLVDAADAIERLYDVKIVFSDKAILDHTLWATFEDQPLNRVLESIKAAGGLSYKIEGRVIYMKESADMK
jgi:ferric-dicitrate binding protein FerR (iron transport regulator)